MPTPQAMHAPHPMPTQSMPIQRSAIDIREALKSTLRAWLVSRDIALWCFCSGSDPEGDCLEPVELTQAQPAVDQMNTLRTVALQFAAQLASKTESPDLIMRGVLTELLSSESPKFLLQVPYIPTTF